MLIKKLSPPFPTKILMTNLNHFAEKYSIHEAELARQTGIPQPTLHKIMTGKTTDPRISTIQTLADYFGVTLDALYAETPLNDNRSARKGKPIPIITWSQCTHYQKALKTLSSTQWLQWVVVDDGKHQNALFALKSKATCEPHFPRGTIFIIDTKITPHDGDFVVAYFPSTTECTLRELSVDGKTELLLPLNHHAKPDKLSKSIRIIGTVTESRFSFDEM